MKKEGQRNCRPPPCRLPTTTIRKDLADLDHVWPRPHTTWNALFIPKRNTATLE
jgi:hypothetical protein